MEIEEASAKVKATGPDDIPAEPGWTAWSGVLPVEMRLGPARPAPGDGSPGDDLAPYGPGVRLDAALALRPARS